MQTFLPFPHFTMSAQVLDKKRLGKQRVETLQILKVLWRGKYYCNDCQKTITHFNPYKTGFHCYDCEAPLKMTGWYNHPAVQLWIGHPWSLYNYLTEICKEWSIRGYKDTCYNKASILVSKNFSDVSANMLPHWFGNEKFHSAHRAALLFKNYEYYKQFAWKEEPKLEYFWPKSNVLDNHPICIDEKG